MRRRREKREARWALKVLALQRQQDETDNRLDRAIATGAARYRDMVRVCEMQEGSIKQLKTDLSDAVENMIKQGDQIVELRAAMVRTSAFVLAQQDLNHASEAYRTVVGDIIRKNTMDGAFLRVEDVYRAGAEQKVREIGRLERVWDKE